MGKLPENCTNVFTIKLLASSLATGINSRACKKTFLSATSTLGLGPPEN
jgi:hypothetical protein